MGSRRAFELGTVLGAAAWLLKVATGGVTIQTPPYYIPMVFLHTNITGGI